jgi:hypothetical protein
MNTTVRHGAVAVLLLLLAACGSSGPTSPTAINQFSALPAPTPPPVSNFPPLSGPSRTFVFDRELLYAVTNYTKNSRLVLYDNGAFVLEYVSLGGGYRGRYTDASGVITFEWEGWSSAGPWGATGSLRGDSLTMQYNLIMQLTDFEDAVYVLQR